MTRPERDQVSYRVKLLPPSPDHGDEKVQEGIFYHGTKEELQDYTRGLILRFGKKGLMLGGDCIIDVAIDWERIRWIVEAARSL